MPSLQEYRDSITPKLPKRIIAPGKANWRSFKESIMALNAREAFSVACQIDYKAGGTHILSGERNMGGVIADLLINYTAALSHERDSGVNNRKVGEVVSAVLFAGFRQVEAYADKLERRIEFRNSAAAMPRDIESIYERAMVDADNGSSTGFHWGCFLLRRAFQAPLSSTLSLDDAFKLYVALSTMPGDIVDKYEEAGLDVAVQMERHLKIVNKMPVHSAQLIFSTG